MYDNSLFSALGRLEDACASVADKFNVDNAQLDRLRAEIASLKGNRGAFTPQVLLVGARDAGKTVLLKHLVHDWWPGVMQLPSSGAKRPAIPTAVHLEPEEGANATRPARAEIVYMTRDDYVDGALWVCENLVGADDETVRNLAVRTRKTRSLEDLKKTCEAALHICGADMQEMRKSLRKIADDCRNADDLEGKFRSFAAQSYRKACTDLAVLNAEGNAEQFEFAKAVVITAFVSREKIPCAVRFVDTPGADAGDIHALAFAHQLSRKETDVMIACIPADAAACDGLAGTFFDKLVGKDSHLSRRADVIYAATKTLQAGDEKIDSQSADQTLRQMIDDRGWTQPGLGDNPLSNRIFVIDALAGVLHELRAEPDLQDIAKRSLGLADEQHFKAIKKKWNSGRVGDDNAGLKLTLRKQLTYDLPRENVAAVKSAAGELAMKFRNIVSRIKPEQSRRHNHGFAAVSGDALSQFENRAGALEAQIDQLHKTLRTTILSNLSKAMPAKTGESADAAKGKGADSALEDANSTRAKLAEITPHLNAAGQRLSKSA